MHRSHGLYLLSLSGLTEENCVMAYRLVDREKITVIDIHQGAVYDKHTINLLLDVHADQATWWGEQITHLNEYAQSEGISLAVISVTDEEYKNWLAQRGKPHYIMTILAEGLSGKVLVAMEAVLRKYDMRIEMVQRLSGYANPVRKLEKKKREIFAVEFMLRGSCQQEGDLRTELLVTGQKLDINIGLQRDTIYRRHRRLLAMDMDSTLIEIEIIDELARMKSADTAEAVEKLTRRAMDGGLNFEQSLKERVRLLKGISVENLEALANKLPVRQGAAILYRELRKLGYTTAIISGGFDFFANIIKKQLKIDRVYANSLEIRNGVLTGKIVGDIIDSKTKALCLQNLADELGINIEQSIAVGDGANDIEMISKAGLGIAYHSQRTMLLRHASHTFAHVNLDGILYLIGLRPYEAANGAPYFS